MERIIENNSVNHIVSLNERKSIVITGVKKIESFDNEEFLLATNLGMMLIKGEGLEMIKLDTLEGNVSIKGRINSLGYMDVGDKSNGSGLFNKLFK
ncbi:MAG TPA: sporulation protein YabP [Firmicutes bacterium]|nr:sporulation protein YabP [Bacillota bacterium]